MFKVIEVVRLAAAIQRADPASLERYELFLAHVRSNNGGRLPTEEYVVRETYDQWRRRTIELEVQASLGKTVLGLLAKDLHTWLSIATIIFIVVATTYPPFQYSTQDQSIHLGFASAFDRQAGTVNGAYLIGELAGIGMVYLLARDWLRRRASESPSA